jgi:hypothetical protein
MDMTSRKGCRVLIDVVVEKSAYEKFRDERVAELAMRLKPIEAAANNL